ncbi:MAG: hypothetical protein J7647_32400 [Cyanobacteria bacterium SBLK]|nr:hypothetical protein [Cyanobacteria bacterium SBLK]
MNLDNSDPTNNTESSSMAIEVFAQTEEAIAPLTGDYLDRKAEELAIAKQRFANACYYAMLAEGLTWYEIFLPITGRLDYDKYKEVCDAFDRLVNLVERYDIPNVAKEFYQSAEEKI